MQTVRIPKGDSHYEIYIRYTNLRNELKDLKANLNQELSQAQSRFINESSLFQQ